MIRPAVLVSLACAALSACSIPINLPDSKTCGAGRAMGYVGQRYTQRIGKIVKAKAGATYVRTIPPGTMVTKEFRANRLNLDLDERTTITRIYCG